MKEIRELNLMSFKNFYMRDIIEKKGDLMKEWISVVNIDHVDMSIMDISELKESDKKHYNNVKKMVKNDFTNWTDMDWMRCRKYINVIQEELLKETPDRELLKFYGHKG